MSSMDAIAERALAALTDHDRVRLTPYADAVVDEWGYDPRSPYCERYWLPVIGPSAWVIGRRLAVWLTDVPTGMDVSLPMLGRAVGLGGATNRQSHLPRSLARMAGYGLVLVRTENDRAVIAARRNWPPLTRAQVAKLPVPLARAHDGEAAAAARKALAAAA